MAHVHGEADALTRQHAGVDSDHLACVGEQRSSAAATGDGGRALDVDPLILGFDGLAVRRLANPADNPAGRAEIEALRMPDRGHRVTECRKRPRPESQGPG